MKKAIKKIFSLTLISVLALTLVPSMTAKAEQDRNYPLGPFKVSSAKKLITISPETAENVFYRKDTDMEILVVGDYFEIELDYERMGWNPDDFTWGHSFEDVDDGLYVIPGEESCIYQDPWAIGQVDGAGSDWESTGGGVPSPLSHLSTPGNYYYYEFDKDSFVQEYEDFSPDYWLWCFAVDKIDEDYSYECIILHESEYNILKETGFPVVAEKDVASANSFRQEKAGTVYRLGNPTNGDHIYTINMDEAKALVDSGWNQETTPGVSAGSNGVPVYRLTNDGSGEHLFTADKREKDTLAKNGWTVDNGGKPAFYGFESGKAVYRLFNPNAQSALDSHHFTLDKNEIKVLTTQHGWEMDNDGKAVYYLK